MKTVLIMCFGKNGSGPAFTLNLAKGFSEAGNNVYCIVSNSTSNIDEWKASENLEVLYLDTGNRKTIVNRTIKFLYNKKTIVDFLKNDIDISIQTFVHPWMQIINRWVKPKHKMAFLHDPCAHSGENKITAFLAYIQYRMASEVIVLTKEFIPIVQKKYRKSKNNIYFARHGIFESYRNSTIQSSDFVYPETKTNFVFFGRIEEYKGISILLDSYEKVSKKYSNITLTIAGSGDISNYRKKISQLPNVNLINRYIEDNEIKSIFTGANLVLVLPYLDATQSGVAPIAIDFGIPVIASNSGGLREQLNDGEIGLFVEPGSVESLEKQMISIIENPDIAVEQRRNEKNFKNELLWSNIAYKLICEIERRELL